ncbi:MAG TPA: CoA pyrophosphatase [Salinivirgaceae bacterium]|nr:CoA pyrophosphatase [Salinivirgaceae bacterium]
MSIEIFIKRLSQSLQRQLPGENAHRKFLPKERSLIKNVEETTKGAVLIVINFKDNEPYITFIQRSQYDGHHSGQIAFPGGKFDPSLDLDLMDTALRETYEEIGLRIEKNQILGGLTPLFIPVSKIMVFPFVAIASSVREIAPDYREVADVFSIPISAFNEGKIKLGTFGRDSNMVEAPYWDVDDHKIWGATAMILNEFLEILS